MKPVTSFFLGIGSTLLVSAAIAAAAPRPGAWLAAVRAPQISGLSPAQQATFDALRRTTQAQHRAAHAEVGALIGAAREELARPDADLAALSAQAESTLLPLVLEARARRAEGLAFYDGLGPEQQAQLRTWMSQRLARIERLHAVVGDVFNEYP